MKNILIIALLLLVGSQVAYGEIRESKPPLKANTTVHAPVPGVPATTVEIDNSATTTTNIPKYNLIYAESYIGQVDCLALRDSDGEGVTYITGNDGVLSAATSCE